MTRRIVVALDESPASYQALRSAVRLAAEMSAEILALFIEETDLFSVAAMPYSSIVSFEAGDIAPLDENVLRRSLRLQARRLREDVARIASDYRVSWQFEVARGRVCEEILKYAESSEMLAIGASSRLRQRALGANVGTILREARCSVLVFHGRSPAAARIVVMSEAAAARQIGETLVRMIGALGFEAIEPQSARDAFDRLMRLAPSHVVTDRALLAKIGVAPQELVNVLDLEALILASEGNP
ncbi:MAG: universal stress protein [Alphaproteobacteria bacterium]